MFDCGGMAVKEANLKYGFSGFVAQDFAFETHGLRPAFQVLLVRDGVEL